MFVYYGYPLKQSVTVFRADCALEFILEVDEMDAENKQLRKPEPILRRIQAYGPYPFTRISARALQVLEDAAASLPQIFRRSFIPLLKMLECLLCLTQKTLDCRNRNNLRIGGLYEQLVGAISSPHFVLCSHINSYNLIRVWNALVEQVDRRCIASVRMFYLPSSTGTTNEIATLVIVFEHLQLNPDEVFYWRNSQIERRSGELMFVPIRRIGIRYGRKFAEFIHSACQGHIFSNNGRVIEVNVFLEFLIDLPRDYVSESFADGMLMAALWKSFKRHFVETFMGVSNYDTVYRRWIIFLNFALKRIDGKGFFGASPWHLTPLPGGPAVKGTAPTQMDADGAEVEQKLLVDVPLHVSDEQALRIIFCELEDRVGKITKWASQSVSGIWKRYSRRIEAARKGEAGSACLYNVSHFDDLHFERMAAKFEKTGFDPAQAKTLARPLGSTAFDLGLPMTGALLPHMALLVIAHNELTPILFDECELYDKQGQISGLVFSDNGPILQGFKLRRGPSLAHMVVHLTPETLEVVTQVIALTQPLRDYLKAQGDDNWRKLFLTCGAGFGAPKGIKATGLTSDVHRVKALEIEFVREGIVAPNQASLFVKRFSLRSLRATVAVVSYIKTPDAAAFAKKLGHAKFDPALLSKYMPAPLYRFFQQRWIRLFQCAIIATAMEKSELVLRSTGFETMKELHEFFKNHALKLHPRSVSNDAAFPLVTHASALTDFEGDDKPMEVIFAVSVDNLSALLSLTMAVQQAQRPVNLMASYWATYCHRLVSHIESRDDNSADLHDILTQARTLATPDGIGELIYA